MKALLIDIGNSRIKGRLLDRRAMAAVDLEPMAIDRLDQLADRWRSSVDPAPAIALISSVASIDAEASLVRWLRATAPAIRIERVVPEQRTAGVTNGYRDPGRLGADRWMALVGAHALMPDRSMLVCGFGTATTLDLLRHDGDRSGATFIGGSILPGFEAMHVALRERTARLDVPRGAVVDFADNTEDAIAGGVMLAQVGALREAWQRAGERTTSRPDCVIAGGAGRLVVEALDRSGIAIHHVPDLVMRGLEVLADRWSAVAHASSLGVVSGA